MHASNRLTIRGLRVRAVNVPLALPLQTSSGTISIAPLVLIDLTTEQGITGRAYLFCYTPLVLGPVSQLLTNLDPVIKGDPVAPLELYRRLQARFRLLGSKGVAGMALAGIDMAAWDALSKAQGLPLARALGGDLTGIPAYNSCGLGMIGADRAASEAETLAAPGYQAIKVRLGYADLKTDIAVVRAVKRAIGDDIHLMSDYNQALSVPEAIKRVQVLDDEGLYWIEEPALADDYAGYAAIGRKTRTPIQMGENWWGPHEMARSIEAGASSFGMPDAMKIGGVTGWLRAAALADSVAMPVSSHLFPEISVHLLAASPTGHWLEYVDWAAPILKEPLTITNGWAVAREEPGIGIDWDEPAVERYLVQ